MPPTHNDIGYRGECAFYWFFICCYICHPCISLCEKLNKKKETIDNN